MFFFTAASFHPWERTQPSAPAAAAVEGRPEIGLGQLDSNVLRLQLCGAGGGPGLCVSPWLPQRSYRKV